MSTKTFLRCSVIAFLSFAFSNIVLGQNIFWSNQVTESIYRSDLDITTIEVIHSNEQVTRRMQYHPVEDALYWIEGASGKIKKSNIDGSDEAVVLDASSNHLNLIEIDFTNNRIFYTINFQGSIKTINLDGSNSQAIISGVENVQALAYDHANDFIYWTEMDKGLIMRATGDGDEITTIFETDTKPYEMELDTLNGHIYYVDRGTNEIYRIDVDGSNQQTIISTTGLKGLISLDMNNNHLYWINAEFNFISRANLDGSDINLIYTSTTEQLAGFEVATIPQASSSKELEISTAINLYPNPSSDILKIDWSSQYIGEAQIQIINLAGKIIYQKSISKFNENWKTEINIRSQPTGMYFITFIADGKRLSKRFIHTYSMPTP